MERIITPYGPEGAVSLQNKVWYGNVPGLSWVDLFSGTTALAGTEVGGYVIPEGHVYCVYDLRGFGTGTHIWYNGIYSGTTQVFGIPTLQTLGAILSQPILIVGDGVKKAHLYAYNAGAGPALIMASYYAAVKKYLM